MARLAHSSILLKGLAFLTAAISTSVSSEEIIGLRPHSDIPIDHFIHCIEAVRESSYELTFDELKAMDPWELWRKERERVSGSSDHALIRASTIFRFSIRGDDYEDYVIVATNLAGGRSYIADPRRPCFRLVFRSDQEKEMLSKWMRKLYTDQIDEHLTVRLFLTIPYLRGLLDGFDTPEKKLTAYRLMANFLGDFLSLDHMVDLVCDTAFRHLDATTRENCILGILSAFESLKLKPEAKDRLAAEVQQRLVELDDVEVKGNAWRAESERLQELRVKLQSDAAASRLCSIKPSRINLAQANQ